MKNIKLRFLISIVSLICLALVVLLSPLKKIISFKKEPTDNFSKLITVHYIENKPLTQHDLITVLDGNFFPIKDIMDGKTLHFRFSEAGYSPCIQEQVSYLKRH